MAKKSKLYHCPRCGSDNVVNFKHTIFCKACKNQFDKEVLEELDDDQILSENEKSVIFQAFKDFAEKKEK